MACAASSPAGPIHTQARLWPKIAVVLLVKVVGLTVIWFLFIRGHQVNADAHSTAQAFGLTGRDSAPQSILKEDGHGQ